jgi:hypothetical protein
MNTHPILFLDSGIGCLPYAAFFPSCNASESVICVGDRANFPYGAKLMESLLASENPHLESPRASSKNAGLISFKITGKSELEPYWEKLAYHFGMSLETI